MPFFTCGKVVATPGVPEVIGRSSQSPGEFLCKYTRGEWDALGTHDAEANHAAIRDGGRVFGSFTTRAGDALWVITEVDRASTCLLLPGDY